MHIDRIRITNFKSIQELDLNFQEMEGLWEISGVVGSGKTTVGEAIIFALFGSVRGKTNESLITWGKKHTVVEAWVYCKNRHIHIYREINSYGQSPLLAQVDGEEVMASDKRSIQGILENEWYDISRQTLELLCVISFNNFKSLSTLNTADSREFLNSTIAFDRIDAYEGYCKDRMREAEERIHRLEGDRREQEGILKALDDMLPEKPRYTDLEQVKALERQALETLNRYRKDVGDRRKDLDAAWRASNDKVRSAQGILKNLEGTFSKLKGGVCPLCGQPVTPEHRTGMEQEITQQKAVVEDLRKDAEAAARKVDTYDLEVSQEIQRLEGLHNNIRMECVKTEEYERRMKDITKRKETCHGHLETYVGALDECRKHTGEWKEMLDFLREKVRPTIIASIIPSINKYITYYMGRIHQNYVVFYDDSFRCMMRNAFGEPIPISSLSTGQKKIIDMVIILAFVKTFITQIDFNVYFMDELIGNMDSDLRDTMCTLLRETLDDGDVMFLISHSPINQAYLNGVIKVTMASGISEYTMLDIAK